MGPKVFGIPVVLGCGDLSVAMALLSAWVSINTLGPVITVALLDDIAGFVLFELQTVYHWKL